MTGAAIITTTDYSGTTYLLHFADFTSPITLGAGKTIEVDVNTLVG